MNVYIISRALAVNADLAAPADLAVTAVMLRYFAIFKLAVTDIIQW